VVCKGTEDINNSRLPATLFEKCGKSQKADAKEIQFVIRQAVGYLEFGRKPENL